MGRPKFSRLCRRLLNRLGFAGALRLPAPLRSLLGLLCGLALGLLPPGLLLLFSLAWCFLPALPPLDLTWFSLAALLASPFIAGYVCCRCRGAYSLGVGALPGFLLWTMAAAAYYWLFGLPQSLRRAGISLLVALLLAIAGGMCASKNPSSKNITPENPPAKAS